MTVDEEVGQWVAGNRLGWLDPVFLVVTQLGSSILLIPLLLVVGLTLGVRRRAWSPLALLASAMLGAIALYTAGKALTGRLRPQYDPLVVEETFSFPSGHSTQAAAAWLALAAVAVAWLPPGGDSRRRRRLIWAGAAAVAVAVAFSRIYLGVHWLSDTLAGLALGGGWALLLVRLVGRDLGSASARPEPPPASEGPRAVDASPAPEGSGTSAPPRTSPGG